MMSEGGKDAVCRLGQILSVPMVLLLMAFFFLPWVKFSCNADQTANYVSPEDEEFYVAMEMKGEYELATASGMQIARGQLEEKARPETSLVSEKEMSDWTFAQKRPWMFYGIVGPAMILAFILAGLVGLIPTRTVGRVMILLGIIGITVVFLASKISYAEDMTHYWEQRMIETKGGQLCLAEQQSLAKFAAELEQNFITHPLPYLWGSLGLYCGVIFCGAAVRFTGREREYELHSDTHRSFVSELPVMDRRKEGADMALGEPLAKRDRPLHLPPSEPLRTPEKIVVMKKRSDSEEFFDGPMF